MKQDKNELDIVKLCREIDKKAEHDPAFRELLLEKPAEALKQLGVPEIVNCTKAEVIEKGICQKQNGELSEDELDQVAGGFGIDDIFNFLKNLCCLCETVNTCRK